MIRDWLPLTNYQMRQASGQAKMVLIIGVIVLLLGNLISMIVHDRVSVNGDSFVLKDGFPLFISQIDYINFIRSYPHNPGVKLTLHRMEPGESYWDVSMRYHITIDTLIAANPFLTSLVSYDGVEVVIPAKNGVLFAFDDFIDVLRMKRRLGYAKKIKAGYLPNPFLLFSDDDIKLVFFEEKRPVLVNVSLERLYRQKNVFQSPIYGYFTSLFGNRVDPIYNSSAFHNGVDIIAPMNVPIKPARDGMVVYTGWRAGYGKTVIVQHDDGYATLYGHCSVLLVKMGDWVTKDTVIGKVGSTGRSTGPHLHFTLMRHDEYLNPLMHIW